MDWNITHGQCKTELYSRYHSMKERCSNPKHDSYRYYGKRGISYSFISFEQFIEWALANGYKEGLSLDRIDPDKDYSPENCQWITQSKNYSKGALRSNTNRTDIVIDEDMASELCEAYATGLFSYKDLGKGTGIAAGTIGDMIRAARKNGADIPQRLGRNQFSK